MPTFIAADIHGVNDALRDLYAPLGGDLVFLSPWPGEGSPYPNESEAAQAFHAADGLARYTEVIAQAVAGQPALLIGLSVGATSLWRYVASAECHTHSRAVLYYGSRIREHKTLAPRCPTELVFAAREASFDPYALAAELAASTRRSDVLAHTAHGFMNPCSPHFIPSLAQAEIEKLRCVRDAMQSATFSR